VQYHLSPLRHKPPRHVLANTGRATRDENDLVLKSHKMKRKKEQLPPLTHAKSLPMNKQKFTHQRPKLIFQCLKLSRLPKRNAHPAEPSDILPFPPPNRRLLQARRPSPPLCRSVFSVVAPEQHSPQRSQGTTESELAATLIIPRSHPVEPNPMISCRLPRQTVACSKLAAYPPRSVPLRVLCGSPNPLPLPDHTRLLRRPL
jgi:hypothetical protein